MDDESDISCDLNTSSNSFSSLNSNSDLECLIIVEEYHCFPSPTAVSKLNLFTEYSNPKWFIKTLVVNKSDVRYYNNYYSQGKYFTLELCDGSSTIRAVAFNGACDKFYNAIELNKFYLISNCKIQPSNRIYNKLPHQCELVLQKCSRVEPYLANPSTGCKKEIELPLIKTWTLVDLAREQQKKTTKNLYNVEATVLDIEIPIDKVVYEGCPLPECKKKVVRRSNNQGYYCVKCNEIHPHFEYRYMLKVHVADWTGRLKLTLFEVADQFLGISAPALVKLYQSNYTEYENNLNKRLYERLAFVVDAGINNYNDQDHVQGVCRHYYPIDYKQSSRKLLKNIEKTE